MTLTPGGKGCYTKTPKGHTIAKEPILGRLLPRRREANLVDTNTRAADAFSPQSPFEAREKEWRAEESRPCQR